MLTTSQTTALFAASKIKTNELRAHYYGLTIMIVLSGLALLVATAGLGLLHGAGVVSVAWYVWAAMAIPWILWLVWSSLIRVLIQAMKLFEQNSAPIQEYRAFLTTARNVDPVWVDENLT